MKITIDGRAFQDAAIFASTEEVQYYLQGVAVEPSADEPGYVIAVATDGHRMVAIKAIGAVDPPDARPIINLACLAAVKKARNPWIIVEDGTASVLDLGRNVKVTKPDEVPTATSSFAVASFQNCLIDAAYPDWRLVMPMAVDDGAGRPIAPPAFNAAYLADFAKVSRPSGLKRNSVAPIRVVPTRGNGPAWVFLPERPEFVGLLMPLRANKQGRPGWLDAPKPLPVATILETPAYYTDLNTAAAA